MYQYKTFFLFALLLTTQLAYSGDDALVRRPAPLRVENTFESVYAAYQEACVAYTVHGGKKKYNDKLYWCVYWLMKYEPQNDGERERMAQPDFQALLTTLATSFPAPLKPETYFSY